MKERVTFGSDRYCDTGPNNGMMRIDVHGSIYLTPEEYEQYGKNGAKIVIPANAEGNES